MYGIDWKLSLQLYKEAVSKTYVHLLIDLKQDTTESKTCSKQGGNLATFAKVKLSTWKEIRPAIIISHQEAIINQWVIIGHHLDQRKSIQ